MQPPFYWFDPQPIFHIPFCTPHPPFVQAAAFPVAAASGQMPPLSLLTPEPFGTFGIYFELKLPSLPFCRNPTAAAQPEKAPTEVEKTVGAILTIIAAAASCSGASTGRL